MRCAHPTCHRGIGLVSHRRGWFGTRLYCSRVCRDNYAAEVRQPRPLRSSFEPSLVELLLAPSRSAGIGRIAMANAAARTPASRRLARLGVIAGLCLAATLLLVDPGSAARGHLSSAGGAAASIGNAQQSRQAQSSARHCDPPPCPVRGNAAFFRK
jgi:hypothetical protein